MNYYRLSEARVKRVLNNPKRKELGIAPGTVAVMQPTSSKHSSEIWAMYQPVRDIRSSSVEGQAQGKGEKIRVITAWRYPGKSPIRGPIPIPEEILEELGEESNY